jgi:Reverse transcriptase (RNA-dependent DNA polymerase)
MGSSGEMIEEFKRAMKS